MPNDTQGAPFSAIAARVEMTRAYMERQFPKLDASQSRSGLTIGEAEALLAAASVLAKACVQLLGFCGFSEDCEIVREIDRVLKAGGVDA